jgi:hypothetical protein
MHENSLKPSALDPATVLQLPAQPQLRPRARVNELNSRPIAPPPYRGKLTDISAEMGVLRTIGSRHPSFVSWNFRKSHGIDAKTCVSFGDECDDAGRR